MVSNKLIIINWIALVLLTLAAVGLGFVFEQGAIFIGSALLIVALKGKQIVDVFMELQHAPKNWRLLFIGYISILPIVLCLIYLL